MRVLILGDLHCRPIWKDIVEKESYDKVVFLGDYTCPREVKLDDPTDACGFLYEILEFKDNNPDKVVLLRGNHDDASLGYSWAECYPKDHPKVRMYWRTKDFINWFLSNTQWIYRIPDTNIVCSHAGISEKFLDNVRKHLKSDDQLIDHINDIEPCELFGFTSDNIYDETGTSATQPCTWIRPLSLLNYGVKDIIHVVGHTPVDHICNLKEAYPDSDFANVWVCDCLANGEYLIIDNNEFKVCKRS